MSSKKLFFSKPIFVIIVSKCYKDGMRPHTLLGTLPFLITIWVLCTQTQWLLLGSSPTVFITTYSSVIISFIAGRLWGLSLKIDGMSLISFLTSNLITLIAWTTVLFLSIKLILIAHMILYILLLNIDRWLYRQQVIESYQLNERIMATVLVVIMLGMMILLV